jgi:hypothetical protein
MYLDKLKEGLAAGKVRVAAVPRQAPGFSLKPAAGGPHEQGVAIDLEFNGQVFQVELLEEVK